MPEQTSPERRWLEHLSDEDLAFVRRFVLLSGSLKQVARHYGISYPTVRLRLDRLIDKIRLLEEAEHRSAFEQTLRAEYADGRLAPATFKRLLLAYQQEKDDA